MKLKNYEEKLIGENTIKTRDGNSGIAIPN